MRVLGLVGSPRRGGNTDLLVSRILEGADACEHLVGMFELSSKYLGITLADKMLVKAYEKAEVNEQPETLNRAFKLGKTLK